jgi:hypothetical protein
MKEIHPIAECYPPLSPEVLAALEEHVKLHGQQNDIILFEGKVLDGKHRQMVCLKLGFEPRYASPDIADPYAYVVGANERRRHLTTGQRAIVAARMAKLKINSVGANQHGKEGPRIRGPRINHATKAYKEASALHNIGLTSIDEARCTENNGIPELSKALEAGKLKPYRAKEISKLPKEQQAAALNAALSGNTKPGKRERGQSKRPKPAQKNKETAYDRMERVQQIARKGRKPGELVGLSHEQVDPDFKGTPMEWLDKYGHVQIMTKAELEADRKQAALLSRISALNDLREPLAKYLKTEPFALEEVEAWIGKSPERRQRKFNEMLSMANALRDSIEQVTSRLRSS